MAFGTSPPARGAPIHLFVVGTSPLMTPMKKELSGLASQAKVCWIHWATDIRISFFDMRCATAPAHAQNRSSDSKNKKGPPGIASRTLSLQISAVLLPLQTAFASPGVLLLLSAKPVNGDALSGPQRSSPTALARGIATRITHLVLQLPLRLRRYFECGKAVSH